MGPGARVYTFTVPGPKWKSWMNRMARVTPCYLCGRPLSGPTSKDHCPPRALFSQEIRRKHNLSQLITFRVHKDCNASYQRDEEYFKATMMPFAPGSEAGNAIYEEFFADSRSKPRKLELADKILREFEPRPSGLHLPPGLVAKRQEGDRFKRVVWKIIRGLYFHHYSTILPEALPVGCTLTAPGQLPPEEFRLMIDLADDETKGRYQGVFDYRFRVVEMDVGTLNYWAFLIWDRIIVTAHFHDPWSCQCEDCTSAVAEMAMRVASSPTASTSSTAVSCEANP